MPSTAIGTVAPLWTSPRSSDHASPSLSTFAVVMSCSGLACRSLYVRPYAGQFAPSSSFAISAALAGGAPRAVAMTPSNATSDVQANATRTG
jgi:hypothetical protein